MKRLFYLFIIPVLACAVSCNGDGDPVGPPDVEVAFASGETGLDAADAQTQIALSLSRAAEVPITVKIGLEAAGVEYGTGFTTTPAPVGDTLSVTIPAGHTGGSFAVAKVPGAFYDGTEKVTFTLASLSVDDGVRMGARTTTSLLFGTLVSRGDEMTLDGGGATYGNSVYVDLSNNAQTPVARMSWNLGFWCGEEFRVVLNETWESAATPSGKTDIDAVTLADANAVDTAHNLNTPLMPPPTGLDFGIFDSPGGSLDSTAIGEVSAVDAENPVYFVASAADKTDRGGWWKVRITRAGEGYRVQFGKVDGTVPVRTVTVAKREGYNFTFLSFDSGGEVSVEPRAARWDIKWSYDEGASTRPGYTSMIMFMQDYVSINNLGGVSAAMVMTSTVSYDDFDPADAAALTFISRRDVIGDTWRSVGMGASQIHQDRFYVIKDGAGFIYKLRFVRAGIGPGDTGTRGRPEIEYALVE